MTSDVIRSTDEKSCENGGESERTRRTGETEGREDEARTEDGMINELSGLLATDVDEIMRLGFATTVEERTA
jgi:hypothetical protein